jgi:beta-lactamase class A
LQLALKEASEGFGEGVAIAVRDLQDGWTASVDGDRLAPQQSVSKLWVAVAVLDAADRGALELDRPLAFTDADRSVFFQPIVSAMTDGAYITSARDLLRRAIVESDNAANDKLLRLLGGAAAVDETARRKRLAVSVGAEERHLQAAIAGLAWQESFGFGANFKLARARLPMTQRAQARARYLASPTDGASPVAIVDALARLHRGELLSPASTAYLLGLMEQVTTGPKRLRGGLPPDWRIAHKTGTGQDLAGRAIGINDVGVITAPDGRAYAVAVMIPDTAQSVPARLELMQNVAGALVAEWRRSSAATPGDYDLAVIASD